MTTRKPPPEPDLHTYIAMWPVLDESISMRRLQDQAADALDELIAEARVVLLAEPTFELVSHVRLPEMAEGTLVLVARAPACSLLDWYARTGTTQEQDRKRAAAWKEWDRATSERLLASA